MAVYIPIRPKWNPRGEVVNYVCGGKLCARSWPKGYQDANTATQQRQRGKMRQVCAALPYVKNLLAQGYSPREKSNGRRVGSYHAAVSLALREWFVRTAAGEELELSRMRLTDGASALPAGCVAERIGEELRVAWCAPLRVRRPMLLLAARVPATNQWLSLPVALDNDTLGCSVMLPVEWAGDPIQVWVAFAGASGRGRTATLFRELA